MIYFTRLRLFITMKAPALWLLHLVICSYFGLQDLCLELKLQILIFFIATKVTKNILLTICL